jgi:hypothetical protein
MSEKVHQLFVDAVIAPEIVRVLFQLVICEP